MNIAEKMKHISETVGSDWKEKEKLRKSRESQKQYKRVLKVIENLAFIGEKEYRYCWGDDGVAALLQESGFKTEWDSIGGNVGACLIISW
jgi:hypothetical protein